MKAYGPKDEEITERIGYVVEALRKRRLPIEKWTCQVIDEEKRTHRFTTEFDGTGYEIYRHHTETKSRTEGACPIFKDGGYTVTYDHYVIGISVNPVNDTSINWEEIVVLRDGRRYRVESGVVQSFYSELVRLYEQHLETQRTEQERKEGSKQKELCTRNKRTLDKLVKKI